MTNESLPALIKSLVSQDALRFRRRDASDKTTIFVNGKAAELLRGQGVECTPHRNNKHSDSDQAFDYNHHSYLVTLSKYNGQGLLDQLGNSQEGIEQLAGALRGAKHLDFTPAKKQEMQQQIESLRTQLSSIEREVKAGPTPWDDNDRISSFTMYSAKIQHRPDDLLNALATAASGRGAAPASRS